MPIIKQFMLGAAIGAGFCASGPAVRASESQPAYFLVIENGGTVSDREAAQEIASHVLGELVELRRRRATREAQIHIILTASPTTISWSGTPEQLYEQGDQVLQLLEYRNTCSDLVLALEEARRTAQITRPSELNLITVGPMIHAGFPCDEQLQITLPQPAPDGLVLGELAAQAALLQHLNVHEDQDEVYFDYYQSLGVDARVQTGELNLDIMGAARTRASLGQIVEQRR